MKYYIVTDKQTVYIIYNREQVQKPLYDWVCEKNPVTKVTGTGSGNASQRIQADTIEKNCNYKAY